jgi:holo-[acyl-carrier protein] synthase
MIHGIGIDMVDVRRMQENIDRFGLRFAGKILSTSEMREYSKIDKPASFLARRFAAKEALAKALGTGFSNGITLKSISIIHGCDGQPTITCAGKMLEVMSARRIGSSHLTITDEKDYACACVILEKSAA